MSKPPTLPASTSLRHADHASLTRTLRSTISGTTKSSSRASTIAAGIPTSSAHTPNVAYAAQARGPHHSPAKKAGKATATAAAVLAKNKNHTESPNAARNLNRLKPSSAARVHCADTSTRSHTTDSTNISRA